MILYMYVALGQGQIISDDKISKLILSFVTSIIFVKAHHDTPNSKGTRGQKPFFFFFFFCPLTIPSETLLVQMHMQNLNKIRL